MLCHSARAQGEDGAAAAEQAEEEISGAVFLQSLWLKSMCLSILKAWADSGESAINCFIFFLRPYSQSRREESLVPCRCLHGLIWS